MQLPAAWEEARRRPAPDGADPLPERRLARLLGAFIASGLFFLVVPGTLVGVWNLLRISSAQDAALVPPAWIQAHGHAQLLGWVGSFIIGISLYTVPKFRGAAPRSLAAGWLMWGLWTLAVAARWAAGLWGWGWRLAWPAAAAAELVVALLLVWQCSAHGRNRRRLELWSVLVGAGFAGLVFATAQQAAAVWPPPAIPVLPARANHRILEAALWLFCFPVVWGFSLRLLPPLLGLRKSDERAGWLGLPLLYLGLLHPVFTLAAVLLAGRSLHIFEPAARPPKTAGVDPRYPLFARMAWGWAVVAAALAVWGGLPGMTGASRHAFTVGLLASLIFAVGPRILPAFMNSRELWSARLALAAMAPLAVGCTLRVVSEPLAYAGAAGWAWRVLPVSALLELAAVALFALNIGATLATRIPAWVLPRTIHENLPLYWYVASYPDTRRLLERAGLRTLAHVREVPRSLTLREAAEADGIDWQPLVGELRAFFAARQARALRGRHC